MQMPDRMWRDTRQHDSTLIWRLRSRAEVTLGVTEQSFEDDAEAGVLELPFPTREEDWLIVAELLQTSPAEWVDLRPTVRDVPV